MTPATYDNTKASLLIQLVGGPKDQLDFKGGGGLSAKMILFLGLLLFKMTRRWV